MANILLIVLSASVLWALISNIVLTQKVYELEIKLIELEANRE